MDTPLGIFDSGLGGLSVWREIIKILPEENTIYFADSANCPYGEKSREEIRELSEKITEFLLRQSCKLIVVACNTVTSAAINDLRKKYPVLFIGMEPAIKPAAQQTQSKKVGVLATRGTLNGDLFNATKKKYAEGIDVKIQVGEGLVELVEAGKIDSPEAETALREYIEPMLAEGIDQIVLGCTHYPLLLSQMEKITGNKAQVINPAPAVARHTHNVLIHHRLLASSGKLPQYVFYSSGDLQALKRLVRKLEPKRIARCSFLQATLG